MLSKHERVVIMALTLAGASLVALGFGLTDALLTTYHSKAQQREFVECIRVNSWQVYTDTQADNLDFVCRTLSGYRGK